ncbi:hypothetical protein SAMN06297229_1171 [Pseudidiomarina planktonica]|uniref:Uncharacterized protein n=1 Tax=Pseudidiomarina planktonica TaxID=1323738 RepID=A0A1Y6ER69_9GAMM|nr:hypothetical protein [Pseudidiomarina planktonica]RUO65425.1 hypothetical protein CWI77_02910 [Pseudidiomarina planktonica]SMQ65057.1 hypothetical protein SAMN06297229_1171 [Pseudidiomarina planktonica]
MKNISVKWLSIGVLTYIGVSVLISVILSMGLMFAFSSIPPEQLTVVEPSATIFRVGEPVIGFMVSLCVARWICNKTLANKPRTVWAFAAFLMLYGLASMVIHQDFALAAALPKLLAPWVIAFLAVKWSRYSQAV